MTQPLDSDTLLENLEASVLLIDHQQIIQRVNLSTESLFGQSRRYLLGKSVAEVLDSEDVTARIEEVLNTNAQYSMREMLVGNPPNEVLVDMTISQVSTTLGRSSMALVELHSINRISRFMKEQNLAERQQSFRMMMRGLAHEIKNPLGGIRGAAQLLDREITNPGQQELTAVLINEADRLTRLVDRVMGSRKQLNLEFLNIHEVLEHVVELVSAGETGSVEMKRHYDPTLPEIKADKELLIQAVLNVVINAIEALKGQASARLSLTTRYERNLTINQRLHKSAIKISISDNGPGVDEELKEILFDPLITSRPEGSGLGLSITQEILQRHQGTVLLEEQEQGALFAIYLPYLKADTANP